MVKTMILRNVIIVTATPMTPGLPHMCTQRTTTCTVA